MGICLQYNPNIMRYVNRCAWNWKRLADKCFWSTPVIEVTSIVFMSFSVYIKAITSYNYIYSTLGLLGKHVCICLCVGVYVSAWVWMRGLWVCVCEQTAWGVSKPVAARGLIPTKLSQGFLCSSVVWHNLHIFLRNIVFCYLRWLFISSRHALFKA